MSLVTPGLQRPSPQRSSQLRHQSPHVFDFRASDFGGQGGLVTLRSGQTLRFERAGTAQATDSKGTTYTVPANYPAWTVSGGLMTLPVDADDSCVIQGLPLRVRTVKGLSEWIEDGTIDEEDGCIFERSNLSGAAPRLSLRANSGGAYVLEFVSTSESSQAVLPVAPTIGQTVRVRWEVEVTAGSLVAAAYISINGAAWSAEATGASITAPAEYSGDRWHLRTAHSISEDV